MSRPREAPTPFPFSSLPGEYRLRPRVVVPEEHGRHGGRRALSHALLSSAAGASRGEMPYVAGRTLETAHFVQPVEHEWSSVAGQRMFVWTRFRDTPQEVIAGAEFAHPFPSDAADLENPNVWYAERVDTFNEELRGYGIASVLYGHAALFAYRLAKSRNISGRPDGAPADADRLWERLHPGYDEAEDAGELDTDAAVFDDATLDAIVARYAPDTAGPIFDLLPALDNRKWGFRDWPTNGTDSP